MNLQGRNFLTLKDFTPEEIRYFLDISKELKEKKKKGVVEKPLEGKNIALIFEKTSTRTRCSFEVAAHDLGMGVTYLDPSGSQIGKKESIADTARVLGRMFDGIEYRGYAQEIVENLAKYAGVPVWNGLTDEDHPTQVLADFMTIKEKLGKLEGIRFVYAGDGRNNMSNALMIGCAKMGLHYVVASPESLYPEKQLVELCKVYAEESGGSITITSDMKQAVKNADVIYTDVWVSMGEEAKTKERIDLLQPYQVNEEVMASTGKENTIFMHCLPAVRGHEVTHEVLEGKQSVVFDEAENRMHTIKAVMVATLS